MAIFGETEGLAEVDAGAGVALDAVGEVGPGRANGLADVRAVGDVGPAEPAAALAAAAASFPLARRSLSSFSLRSSSENPMLPHPANILCPAVEPQAEAPVLGIVVPALVLGFKIEEGLVVEGLSAGGRGCVEFGVEVDAVDPPPTAEGVWRFAAASRPAVDAAAVGAVLAEVG